MSTTSRVGESFGARLPETSSEARVIEACVIGEGIATDNNVRMEVATDMTSTTGGVKILPTPILVTSTVGHEGPHETGETDGGGKKVGDQDDDEEDCSGRR